MTEVSTGHACLPDPVNSKDIGAVQWFQQTARIIP